MAGGREIDRFVREALSQGHARGIIRRALEDAGWPRCDLERALAAFAETGFVPPVPVPRPAATARDTFLYALTFVALSVVVLNVVSLAFDLIEAALGAGRGRGGWQAIAGEGAAILVFLPVFLWMDVRSRREDRRNPVRKGFAYAGLFASTMVLLVDLVATLAFAFRGGLGLAVALRAAVVAVVAGAVFLYYRGDLKSDSDRPTAS